MKGTKELRTNKGITLIALVITIIVMLILVGVTISMAVNGGLFDYAGRAVSETNNALKAEGQLANGGIEVDGTWYNNIDEYLNKDTVKTISKTESYVGCYADVDGDKIADGVIYADLAFSKSGSWESTNYSYEAIPAEELKDYYVSGTYNGAFNQEGKSKEILTTTGAGTTDRFYVMALSDLNAYCTWYQNKVESGIAVSTTEDFGTGKTNTSTMIKIWNEDTDESKNYNDVWGAIQTQANNGWFVPSKAEWAAFAGELKITADNYDSFGFNDFVYWSSSQYDSFGPYWLVFRRRELYGRGCRW